MLAQGAPDKQLLELRTYNFASPAKQKAFEDFMARAAVPALNRAGIQPVGVFKLLKDDNPALKLEADSTDLYILLPHKSFDSVLSMIGRLASDEVFTGMAQATLDTPKSDPAYTRFESSLMLAFDSVPKVEVPTKLSSDEAELLRTFAAGRGETVGEQGTSLFSRIKSAFS